MLASGSKLGPYQIQDLLGAGGMGEVYRAHDARIGREVAIKILPSVYSEDPNRLTRFQQEARATGLLNHPNILAIYDVGTENGSPYLVSELLEGETLRTKLDVGSLPRRKAIDYALQIIKGLAAAHEKGIVHRDLKPENLFITKDGRLKILDFGLAKLIRAEPISAEQSALQTADIQSQPGLILGTVGYMSPEQVRGRPADHRSDIFTFGTILYEMLTGKRAFHGETPADTMSAILQKDPEELLSATRNVPLGLQRIIDRCMEKHPDDRFQSAHDLAFALEAVSGSSETSTSVLEKVSVEPPRRIQKIPRFWAGAAALFLLSTLLLAIAYYRARKPVISPQAIRFEIPPGDKTYFSNVTMPQISPDGKRILFEAADSAGSRRLYIREMDSPILKPLIGTEGALSSFWSSNSRSIAFFSQGKLNRLDLQGGTVQAICDASIGRGGTWNRDNVIVFAPTSSAALFRVSASGGQPEPITALNTSEDELSHRFPQFLPDGKHFLFSSLRRRGTTRSFSIYVGSLDSKERKLLLSTGFNVGFAPPDSLFLLQQSTLMVQRFDPDKLELIGEPRPIVQEVGFVGATSQASFSVSENGVLVYRSISARDQLTVFDRAGKNIGTVGPPGAYEDPALSPDGKRLAVTRDDLGTAQNVWVYEFSRNTFSRFTFNPPTCDDPLWSTDGQNIVYAGEGNIYVKPATAAQPERLLYKDELDKVPLDWSADGHSILFSIVAPQTGLDVRMLTVGKNKPEDLLHSDFNETFAQTSPDGKWIAYSSNESGPYEIYVQSFPELGRGKWQVSSGGGVQPRWRKDGKELFYLAPDGKLMAVPLTSSSGTFEAGTPQPILQRDVVSLDPRRPEYDVFPDGQRFLMSAPSDTGGAPINVILNWPALQTP